MAKNCKKGWHDGSCCCNCQNQRKLMCHPWNKEFGKGSIMESCGWVCLFPLDDGSSKGEVIFFDREHGMCELYTENKS